MLFFEPRREKTTVLFMLSKRGVSHSKDGKINSVKRLRHALNSNGE
jgi:hypothetical protein